MFRRLLFVLLLLAAVLSPAPVRGQADDEVVPRPAATKPAQPRPTPAARTAASDPAALQSEPPAAQPPVSAQPPQIVVTAPSTAANNWTWHDKVLWGANLVLVVLGYLGVLLALKTLKNIERQTEFGVSAAQAALQCANASLESSQAIVDSGRPWIVITIEPLLSIERGFKVMATNRGRTPARIHAKADCVKVITDETQLPSPPDYESGKSSTPFEPIILLPGETAGIRPFRRSDVRTYCASDEQFKKVEKWEEKVYIYGRVIYRDLISPIDQPDHETDWCCWYVYGEKDALVLSGPTEYNKHS
jgi:hypothetical protein